MDQERLEWNTNDHLPGSLTYSFLGSLHTRFNRHLSTISNVSPLLTSHSWRNLWNWGRKVRQWKQCLAGNIIHLVMKFSFKFTVYTILSDIASWTSRPTGCRIFLLPAECSPHHEHCHCIRMEPALLPRESRLPSSKFTPHRNCEKFLCVLALVFWKCICACTLFMKLLWEISIHLIARWFGCIVSASEWGQQRPSQKKALDLFPVVCDQQE